ncbi:hypothetical protein BP6252_13847 [Coleophoma cylindrospora]|uniref:Amidohydrolase 3 domain-containing protein n=1 Tax=Coleophoma cylindrospora TaxID=1849047 RepID=A0A3D8Q5K4_9HELO|nr:hypothetical protein BP6252_13847 [Coleophoma cylindrospora]
MARLFQNGRFFLTPDDEHSTTCTFATAMLVENGVIAHIGGENDLPILQAKEKNVSVMDLEKRIVLPGFVDGHMHILMHGQTMAKLDVKDCRSLEQIQDTVRAYAEANPTLPRILAHGWQQCYTDGLALATMLDEVDPRPIFIDALDLHSTWCNTAALKELDVEEADDPVGGHIHRDANGKPSGLLSEGAAVQSWHHIATLTTLQEKVELMRKGLQSYSAQGYTSVVEMAMDEDSWEALEALCSQEDIHMNIAVHWLITPTKDEAIIHKQVDRAIALKKQCEVRGITRYRIAGVKLVADGVVDACTAHVSQPYSDGTPSGELQWTPELMTVALKHADAAGLQCAIHAIGDAAITQTIDALESLGSVGKRHRIEHLELASHEDAKRLGALGITASVQPVHSDPAILRAWPKLVGHRCGGAFPYMEFMNHGARLAFGSDSPTASHVPFQNLYVATTKCSPTEVDYVTPPAVFESAVVPMVTAVCAATYGSAYSCFAERYSGKLAKGYRADFAVIDMEWDPKELLKSRVYQTWYGGSMVYDSTKE